MKILRDTYAVISCLAVKWHRGGAHSVMLKGRCI